MMVRDWFYNVSSFIPDRLATLGPREATALGPLMTARALELLRELGIPFFPPETGDAVEQSGYPVSLHENAMQLPETSATDEIAEEPKQGRDTVPMLQALTVVEVLFYLQWAYLDEPQMDLDALLSWWGGDAARRHRLRLRPRGLDRLYFGRAANERARHRLKQLLQESELGAAALDS